MFCDNCGCELDRGQTYCGRCGAPVTQPHASQSYQPIPSPPPAKQTGAVSVLVVTCTVLTMVLLGLGLVASGVLKINDAPPATVEPAQTANASQNGNNSSTKETADPSSSSNVTVVVQKTEEPSQKQPEKEVVYVPVPSEPTPAPQPAPAPRTVSSSEYVLPDSNSRYYSASELSSMSNWDLYLARNEIYARHGRGFVREDLQAHFNSCSWYTRRIEPEDFNEYVLSDVERSNAYTMKDIEESRGSPYL